MSRLAAPFRWSWGRFRALPPLWMAVIGVAVAAVAAVGGHEAYRYYDYVQHDNRFCMSCHLMRDPYDRFAESAHAELGCKDCHKPTQRERAMMALRQVVLDPDAITHHAAVPNRPCAGCHVQGDPERWLQIAATEGHRVHFLSDAPELAGLMCVECHSASVHDFVPASRTCAQAGCHDAMHVELGRMAADATDLHCTTCHEFVRDPRLELAGVDTLIPPLTPRIQDCDACHAMSRVIETLDLTGDPHAGTCGACHNPHSDRTPQDAVVSCVGCHVDPAGLTPFHRGVHAGALDHCIGCHTAHGWVVEGANCLACHRDVMHPAASARPGAAAGRAPEAALP